MVAFKSGVDFDGLHKNAVSEKETAMAMLETIKTNSGLFAEEIADNFVAPHFCEYKPVKNGLLPSFTGLEGRAITSYRAKDSRGVMYRHFLGLCSHCGNSKIAAERA